MKEKKQGLFSKIKNFFIDCKIELKKIVWPTQKTVWKNTGIVLALIFTIGIFVALFDTMFLQLLRMVMTVANPK